MAPPSFSLGPMTQRIAVIVGALALSTTPLAAQPVPPSGETDGLLHAELTLNRQLVRVSLQPGLSADDGVAHREVLAGAAGAGLEIGTLEGHRALRLGTIAPIMETPSPASDEGEETEEEDAPPVTPTYDLSLVRTVDGWELEATATDSGQEHRIPLRHLMSARSVPNLSASLHATAAEAGRLDLRWGRHRWSTDFRFEELPPSPRQPRVSGRGRPRSGDRDPEEVQRATEISRGFLLGERDESALVLPDGARVSLAYWKGVDVEDEDYPRLTTTADGDVVELVRASVLRFKTDISLRFGDTDIPTGNVAPGYAGAYGIWLKRVGDGWRFVFTDEPDSWGTQYDPEFDAAEIDADYARNGNAFRPLGATLVPTDADHGRVVVHWGVHEWDAEFTVVR